MKTKLKLILLLTAIFITSIYTEVSVYSSSGMESTAISDTKAANKNGWETKNKKRYYYIDNRAVTGIRRIGSKYYYFSNKGVLQEGAYKWIHVDNSWYYLQKNGSLKTGWLNYKGQKYYLNLSTAKMVTGFQSIDQKKYYFNSPDGNMAVGLKKIKGKNYYFGSNGIMITSRNLKVGSTRYLISSSGALYSKGFHKVGKYTYYVNSNGSIKTGWLKTSNKWYYFRPQNGTMVTGFYTIGGAEYRFNSSGIMKTGLYLVGDSKFYSNSAGVVQTGWKKINNTWYYFRPKTESRQRRASMVWGEKRKINGYYYYLNANGSMAKGWKTLNGYKYFFRTAKVNSYPEGSMVTGWMTLHSNRYYFSSSGIMQKGWESIKGKKYYFNSSGVMLRNTWVDSSHYVGSDGAWIEGYQKNNTSTTSLRWPLSSSYNVITSSFNSIVASSGNIHKGIDIAASTGTTIYAAADGTVISKQLASDGNGFGNWIQISHGDGLITQYCHMNGFGLNVYVNAKVKKGQIVGYVGETGNATGPHLHLGVLLNGVYQNPLSYVKRPN